MNKFYVTFGQVHVHRFNNQTFDRDCVGVVHAKDMEAAREFLFDSIGDKWHNCYSEEKIKSDPDFIGFFPRGFVNLNNPIK